MCMYGKWNQYSFYS